jgi:hypothetical protein
MACSVVPSAFTRIQCHLTGAEVGITMRFKRGNQCVYSQGRAEGMLEVGPWGDDVDRP